MLDRALSLQDLQSLSEEIEKSYTGYNHQRFSLIKLFKMLVKVTESDSADKKKVTKILNGTLIFALEAISSEYNYLNPERSKLYRNIKSKLNLPSDEERLIYLFKCYEYIKDEKTLEEQYRNLFWGSKENLLKRIEQALKTVKKRVDGRIKEIEEKKPVLASLKQNIVELHSQYQQHTQSRLFKNPKRETLGKILDLVAESCEVLYPVAIYANGQNDQAKKILYKQAEDTYMGLCTYALIKIYKEYKVLSPSRSEFYKLCAFAINEKDIGKTDYDKKITYLRALSKHLKDIQVATEYYQKFEEKWKKCGLKDLKEVHAEIEQFILDQEEEKNAPSTAVTVIATTTSYGVQYGLGIAAAKLGMDLILPSMASGLIGGPIGLAIYAGGALLTTAITRLVAGNFLTNVTAGLYSWVLCQIGNAVGNATAGVVVSATRGGLRALISNPNLKQEDRDFIDEFINTLLALPNDIMSETEKVQIRHVLGIGLDAEMSIKSEANHTSITAVPALAMGI